jgi:MFS family permease
MAAEQTTRDVADAIPGPAPAPADPPREPGVMHNRDFVKLWAGQTVSLTGTQITQFTLPLIAVLTLHAGVFQVGLLNASRFAPVVVVSLFAGVWLDRRRRRPILIACSLTNGVLIGLIPLSSVLGVLSINLLYGVTILVGAVSVVFDVGVMSYVPSLVERRHIAPTNSRIQTSTSLAMIVGPGLAGLLVGLLTAPITLSADAVSYLCSAAGLLSIRKPEQAPEQPAERPTVRRSIAEGLHAVYDSRVLRSLLAQTATFNLFQNAFITILVVYAVKVLLLSPFKLGVVLGSIAVGGLLGAMLANRIRGRAGLGRTMAAGMILASLCPLLLLVPSSGSPASMGLLAATMFLCGFGVLMFNVNTISLRQIVTPNRLLGRMNASYRLVIVGTAPLGAVLGGLLGQSLGLRPAFVIAVALMTTPLLYVPFSPVFRLKQMPTGPLEDLPGGGRGATTIPADQAAQDSGTGENDER